MGIDPPVLAMVAGAAVALILALSVFTFIVTRFLYVCPPSEIFIFSGRKQRLSDGSQVGFKVIHGGRAVRIPLLETVSRMDVRLFGVEVGVANAFSRGGIPLTVHAIANVKINTSPAHVTQAVERFLGVPPNQMQLVARQTLEGVLREVLSQLTPEEVNQDRLKFAETLIRNAKDDFDKLGLELDVLKVQHVSDDQKYLANLGRAQIASMIRDAQNAENEAEQVVLQAQALARQKAESAQNQAEAMVLQKKNGFRAEMAKLEAEAKAIENEALVAAETARAIAEQELQRLRAELAKLYLQVETVLPAQAQARAQVAKARGDAAPTVENGRAAAEALAVVAGEWAAAGAHGRDVYVLQWLDAIVAAAVDRVGQMEVGALEIVDGGDAESIGAALGAFPRGVARVLEETGQAIGVDVRALLAPLAIGSGNAEEAAPTMGPETLRGGGGGGVR
jgi:flotillin